MKFRVLPFACCTLLAAFTQTASAQSKKAYAITAETKGSYVWNAIREVDLTTGKVLQNIYEPSKARGVNVQTTDGARLTQNNQYLTHSGVAAAAFDAVHNRLYFTPMKGNTLNYIDLNSGNSFVVNADISFNTGSKADEANVITRMCFGADGYGYALTNDGNNLVRFSTGQVPEIKNLGRVTDADKNGNNTIHNQCTGWGGDMIGDAYGNLWIFSMRNNIYKLNPNTLVAEYMGSIKGLPADFTVNGAAVDADGNVVISSAVLTKNYYRINLSTFEATPVANDEGVFNASDLASSNLAYSAAKTAPTSSMPETRGNQFVSVYPNPVTNKQMNLSFNKIPAGTYTVELTDLTGKRIQTNIITTRGFETQSLAVGRNAANGMYVLKITNAKGETVYSDKLIIQ